MATKWAFITANDVWMFRDSKPFTAGTSFTARSSFPPHPRTMQGFIRTHILEHSGIKWDQFSAKHPDPVAGYGDTLGTLWLTGPFIAQRTTAKQQVSRLFRAPNDLMRNKNDHSLSFLKPKQDIDFVTKIPFDGWCPLVSDVGGPIEEMEGWLSEADFQKYLQGDTAIEVLKDEAIYQKEVRVGLGLDYRARRNKQGLFYHAEFIRPIKTDAAQVGLLVGVDGDQGRFVAGSNIFGGESRTAQIELVPYKPTNLIVATEHLVKVILLTPAWFSDGWQPKGGDWSPWVGDGQLVALSLGKPQLISGWDLAKKAPRPIQHFVPVGSVFYFENATLTGQAFTETPHQNDVPHDTFAKMGFGTYASTAWNYLD